MLTSITPGSGVTLMLIDARIVRRRVAFDHHRHVQMRRRVLDRGHQLDDNPRSRAAGGMKTYRWPSRGSTHSAVRTIQGADSPTAGLRSRSRSRPSAVCSTGSGGGIRGGRPAARPDSPSDPTGISFGSSVGLLPTAGSAAADAGRPANRRAPETDAGRAASTVRSATRVRSSPPPAATAARSRSGCSSPRSNTCAERSRSPSHPPGGCPPDPR